MLSESRYDKDIRVRVHTCKNTQTHQSEGNMIKSLIRNFAQNEKGATAIEYGLIAAGIAVAIAVVVFALGTRLNIIFNNILSAISQ